MVCVDPIWANYTHANVSIKSMSQGGAVTVQCHPGYEFVDGKTTKMSECLLTGFSQRPAWQDEIREDCQGKASRVSLMYLYKSFLSYL